MMNTEKRWIKRLEDIIEPSIQVPMWKNIPDFPLESFAQALSQELSLPNLDVTWTGSDWKHHGEIMQGFGANPVVCAFEMTPLSHPCFLILSNEEIEKISSWTLSGNEITSSELKSAYFEYLLAKTLKAFDQQSIYSGLHPKISNASIPNEEAYLIDFSINCENDSCNIRLCLPKSFQSSFNVHMSEKPFSLMDQTFTQSMHVSLPIEVGYVALSMDHWKSVNEGDFIILDQCTFHPNENKGTMSLYLYDNPLFQLKLKDGKCKLLDYIFYNEDYSMNDDEFDEFDDEFDENFFEDDQQPQEEQMSYESGAENKSEEYESPSDYDQDNQQTPQEQETNQTLISPEKVPLNLKVEAGRLQMSLHDVMQLKPGNTISLVQSPQQGVVLTLNNNVIAHGELIEMGDAIGVKITKLK